MVLYAANIDLGTTTLGRVLHIIIIFANSYRSSFSSTVLLCAATFNTFSVVFHVRSFRFFIGAQILTFPCLILSLTKLVDKVCPMILCLHKFCFTFSGTTTLVTRFMRLRLFFKKGLVNSLIVLASCSIFFSWWDLIALLRFW